MKKFSKFLGVVSVGTLAITLAACGSNGGAEAGNNSASSDAATPVKIGLVTKTDTNPFFVKLREAAKEAAAEEGAEVVALAGKFDGDNEGQVAAIENLVAQGVKGILITPNSSTGILSAIKKARDSGVVVVALDTATEPADAVDATFATDNLKAGVLQGTWVKATLGSKAPSLIMLDGTPGGTVDTFRHDGFLEGMGLAEGAPEISGQENTNGDQTKAQTAMENLLQRVPNANSLYTINEPAAAGAYQAIKAAGKQDQITIGSIDGSCTGVDNVKKGIIGATVMQFPGTMAAEGVKSVVEYAKSGTKPTGFTDTGTVIITDTPVSGVDSKDTAWGLENCWG
ncbi:substrate-binding domain-containing protein [Paeniglutamicibacter sulfureus]|uniref:Fructose transport system substrate-binding protein n=1 Tax=Paeniglutamicibacter sulfureus TaxID=43666 RepID=A0ABU2BGL1_9MICC|nr:substrate-binding domain-containing protein [Paeniglutamicibacter sulfureus]MDR7357441.1 fructose transport system substrate-binding protein [Paeniglutamicibacter sulfureus]